MTTEEAIQKVWDYHRLGHESDLRPADLIWVLGSHDLRVADRAVELWEAGLAPRILMSGGLGNLTAGRFERPEADLLAERAKAAGVPPSAILAENRSTNTGENVLFGRALLEGERMPVQRVIAVQKPYMERRTFATIRRQWPDVEVQVTSPRFSLADYCTPEIPKDLVVNVMVGDLQRIWEYPKRGFMIEQEVPADVREAWQVLVEAGYDRHLVT